MSDAGLGVDVAISLPPAYSSTQPAAAWCGQAPLLGGRGE